MRSWGHSFGYSPRGVDGGESDLATSKPPTTRTDATATVSTVGSPSAQQLEARRELTLSLEAWDAALARRAPLAEKLELRRRTHAAARRLSLAKGYLALARVTARSEGAARDVASFLAGAP